MMKFFEMMNFFEMTAQAALLIKRPKEADPAAKDPVPPAGFEFFEMTDEYVAKVMKVFEMMKFLQ